MESPEFEVRRGRRSRNTTGAHRSARPESLLVTDQGVRPGDGPPGRRTGPQAPARQDYPGQPAPPQGSMPGWPANRSGPMAVVRDPRAANPPAEPYGYGGDNGYGNGGNNRGYGNDGGTGPYGTGPYGTGWDGPAQRDYPGRRGTTGPRNAATGPRNGESLSVAARILSGADYEAAAITQQASYQAAMIRQQVAYEAKGIREAANREAEQIMQQAAMQASEVREAAAMEAAEIRTAVTSMQTELNEFAVRISNTLPNPVLPRTPPAERPAVSPAASPSAPPWAQPQTMPAEGPTRKPEPRPAARPAGKPAARPAGKPEPRPAGKPGAGSAEKPASGGQGRQVAAFRFVVIATSALFLFAAVAGVAEIHLHGFDFFVFRSVGTGETGPNGLQEDQGPGQPDAPKPTPSHIKVQPGPHSKVAVHKKS
jgi:hypothetical protein